MAMGREGRLPRIGTWTDTRGVCCLSLHPSLLVASAVSVRARKKHLACPPSFHLPYSLSPLEWTPFAHCFVR